MLSVHSSTNPAQTNDIDPTLIPILSFFDPMLSPSDPTLLILQASSADSAATDDDKHSKILVLSNKQIRELFAYLACRSQVRTVTFINVDFSIDHFLQNLTKTVKYDKKYFNLTGLGFRFDPALFKKVYPLSNKTETIIENIPGLHSIQRLSLSGNQLNRDSLRKLTNEFIHDKHDFISIQELDLSDNKLYLNDQDTHNLLIKLLTSREKIGKINLEGNLILSNNNNAATNDWDTKYTLQAFREKTAEQASQKLIQDAENKKIAAEIINTFHVLAAKNYKDERNTLSRYRRMVEMATNIAFIEKQANLSDLEKLQEIFQEYKNLNALLPVLKQTLTPLIEKELSQYSVITTPLYAELNTFIQAQDEHNNQHTASKAEIEESTKTEENTEIENVNNSDTEIGTPEISDTEPDTNVETENPFQLDSEVEEIEAALQNAAITEPTPEPKSEITSAPTPNIAAPLQPEKYHLNNQLSFSNITLEQSDIGLIIDYIEKNNIETLSFQHCRFGTDFIFLLTSTLALQSGSLKTFILESNFNIINFIITTKYIPSEKDLRGMIALLENGKLTTATLPFFWKEKEATLIINALKKSSSLTSIDLGTIPPTIEQQIGQLLEENKIITYLNYQLSNNQFTDLHIKNVLELRGDFITAEDFTFNEEVMHYQAEIAKGCEEENLFFPSKQSEVITLTTMHINAFWFYLENNGKHIKTLTILLDKITNPGLLFQSFRHLQQNELITSPFNLLLVATSILGNHLVEFLTKVLAANSPFIKTIRCTASAEEPWLSIPSTGSIQKNNKKQLNVALRQNTHVTLVQLGIPIDNKKSEQALDIFPYFNQIALHPLLPTAFSNIFLNADARRDPAHMFHLLHAQQQRSPTEYEQCWDNLSPNQKTSIINPLTKLQLDFIRKGDTLNLSNAKVVLYIRASSLWPYLENNKEITKLSLTEKKSFIQEPNWFELFLDGFKKNTTVTDVELPADISEKHRQTITDLCKRNIAFKEYETLRHGKTLSLVQQTGLNVNYLSQFIALHEIHTLKLNYARYNIHSTDFNAITSFLNAIDISHLLISLNADEIHSTEQTEIKKFAFLMTKYTTLASVTMQKENATEDENILLENINAEIAQQISHRQLCQSISDSCIKNDNMLMVTLPTRPQKEINELSIHFLANIVKETEYNDVTTLICFSEQRHWYTFSPDEATLLINRLPRKMTHLSLYVQFDSLSHAALFNVIANNTSFHTLYLRFTLTEQLKNEKSIAAILEPFAQALMKNQHLKAVDLQCSPFSADDAHALANLIYENKNHLLLNVNLATPDAALPENDIAYFKNTCLFEPLFHFAQQQVANRIPSPQTTQMLMFIQQIETTENIKYFFEWLKGKSMQDQLLILDFAITPQNVINQLLINTFSNVELKKIVAERIQAAKTALLNAQPDAQPVSQPTSEVTPASGSALSASHKRREFVVTALSQWYRPQAFNSPTIAKTPTTPIPSTKKI